MRHHRILALATIAALTTACGGASPSSPEPVSASGTATDTPWFAGESQALPVTIEHVHGRVELTEAPERVVSIASSTTIHAPHRSGRGQSELAERLVADVEEQFAAARAAHP